MLAYIDGKAAISHEDFYPIILGWNNGARKHVPRLREAELSCVLLYYLIGKIMLVYKGLFFNYVIFFRGLGPHNLCLLYTSDAADE